MTPRPLGKTGFDIAPLVLGGNVFGWTIDQQASFAVLDAFVDQGFDAIDTADCYSAWAPGNSGGESETIIGAWLKERPGMRDRVKVFTKVGAGTGGPLAGGLSQAHILEGVEQSLRRLGVDAIDLYFAHWPDPAGTSYAETLGAFGKLIDTGKVKAIGVSNVDEGQLAASLAIAREEGLTGYQVLQPEYNLYDRDGFEGALQRLCEAQDIGVVTYYSLASGFLSGKYRSQQDLGQSVRGGGVGKYLDARGMAILAALDAVSQAHDATPAEVALAWLMAQPGVTAPIASATKVSHVESFGRAARLPLSEEELARLGSVGA